MSSAEPNFDPVAAARRVMCAFELQEFATKLTMLGLRHDYPNADVHELRRLLQARLAPLRQQKWRPHD